MDNKSLINLYNKVKYSDYQKIIFFKTKNKIFCFNEDSIIIKRLLEYQISVHYENEEKRYLMISAPSQRLNIILQTIKAKLRVPYVVYSLDYNSNITVNYSKYKTKIKKSDFSNKDDVEHFLMEHDAYEHEMKDFTINQIKRGESKEYILKTKADKIFYFIQESISQALPKRHQALLDNLYCKWITLVENIKKSQFGEIQKKIIYHIEIRNTMYSIDEIIRAIYLVKGFKNQKHYIEMSSIANQIGKINHKLLSKYNS